MGKRIEYTEGQKVGHCFFIRDAESATKQRRAIFRCRCGNEFECVIATVSIGKTQSCGCVAAAAGHKQGLRNRTHGQSQPGAPYYSEFTIWATMRARCYRETDCNYHRYGGRGITMCDEWKDSFEQFFADMGPRPSKFHSIERDENDLGYYPANCHWATRTEQANNRRSNRIITYHGLSLTLAQWAKKTRLKPSLISDRIKYGWDIGKALSIPANQPASLKKIPEIAHAFGYIN